MFLDIYYKMWGQEIFDFMLVTIKGEVTVCLEIKNFGSIERVSIPNIWSFWYYYCFSGFLRLGCHRPECQWNIEFYENSVKLCSV